MRRFSAMVLFCSVLVAIMQAGAVAQESDTDQSFERFFLLLFTPGLDDDGEVVAVTDDGGIVLDVGHQPLPGTTLIIDFTDARPGIDDSSDGAVPAVDILKAWGNVVHLSGPVAEYVAPGLAGLTVGPGFFGSHRGDQPAFPSDGVVIGIETSAPITEADDPGDLRVALTFQLSLTFARDGVPVAETTDANNDANASIDAYPSRGGLGTDAYEFPGGEFEQRTTEFFGFASGNQISLGGPWAELEGAGSLRINAVDRPEFDSVELGDLSTFGAINVYMLNEVDANGNGIYDSLEEPTVPSTAEPTTTAAPASTAVPDDDSLVGQREPTTTVAPGARDSASGATEAGGSTGIVAPALLLLAGCAIALWYYLVRRAKVD